MDFKKTLILSVLFHLCFFAAALLSADLSKGNGKTHEEKVFFVKLAEEEKSVRELSGEMENLQSKTALDEIIPESENNQGLNSPSEKPSDNISSPSYKGSGNEIVNVPYDPFSSGDRKVSAGKGRETLPSDIIKIIRDSIERVKTYPLLARKRGIEGTVYLSFRISPQGKPQNLKILKGSGSSILDTATLEIVKKAAPFPYIGSPVEVPVVFRLDK